MLFVPSLFSIDICFKEIITTLYQHKIVQVACGEQHSMALSEAGQVFVWGANNNGQLGDPEAKDAENRGHPR